MSFNSLGPKADNSYKLSMRNLNNSINHLKTETMNNKREQRCIQLYDKLVNQFLETHILDDTDKGLLPNQESNDYNKKLAKQEASQMVSALIRLSSHCDIDDFNDYWFYYADCIYQDEDPAAQDSVL